MVQHSIFIALPFVMPLTESNTDARVDRLEGTVIVPGNNFLNFVVEVVVNSDPCPPTVFWTFQALTSLVVTCTPLMTPVLWMASLLIPSPSLLQA